MKKSAQIKVTKQRVIVVKGANGQREGANIFL